MQAPHPQYPPPYPQQYPSYPPQQPPQQAWPYQAAPAQSTSMVAKIAAGIVFGIFAIAFIVGVIRGATGSSAAKDPNAGGEIKYAVNGITQGLVVYEKGVRREDAAIVGSFLKEKGWFSGTPSNPISGKARGGYESRGKNGWVMGDPLSKVNFRGGDGFEVIVYTTPTFNESTTAGEFGDGASSELKKRLGRNVRFVLRSEVQKGRDIEFTDRYWDST